MVDIINNLYNLAIFLLVGFIVFFVATLGYLVGVMRCYKNYIDFNKELEKIKIDDMIKKENI